MTIACHLAHSGEFSSVNGRAPEVLPFPCPVAARGARPYRRSRRAADPHHVAPTLPRRSPYLAVFGRCRRDPRDAHGSCGRWRSCGGWSREPGFNPVVTAVQDVMLNRA